MVSSPSPAGRLPSQRRERQGAAFSGRWLGRSFLAPEGARRRLSRCPPWHGSEPPKPEETETGRPGDLVESVQTRGLKIEVSAISRFCAGDHGIGDALAGAMTVFLDRNLLADILQRRRHVGHGVLVKLGQHNIAPLETASRNVFGPWPRDSASDHNGCEDSDEYAFVALKRKISNISEIPFGGERVSMSDQVRIGSLA